MKLHVIFTSILGSLVCATPILAQGPRVNTPTVRPMENKRVPSYPWKKNITATIFWVGEKPTPKNPTPNHASSWDTKWQINFGGYDDPNPKNRAVGDYRPAAFIPKLNPFYVALPYNDRIDHRYHKREAHQVIPWFKAAKPKPGQSVCHNRWLQIVYNNKVCYAQWKDCGPFTTTDYQYVFGNKPPVNKKNSNAGIDLSPAIRDYLKLQSGAKVHWRFIEASQVPDGPWGKYGKYNHLAQAKKPPADGLTQYQRDVIRLRKLRDEQYKKRQDYTRF